MTSTGSSQPILKFWSLVSAVGPAVEHVSLKNAFCRMTAFSLWYGTIETGIVCICPLGFQIRLFFRPDVRGFLDAVTMPQGSKLYGSECLSSFRLG